MSVPKPTRNPEIKYTRLFINNEWTTSRSGKTYPLVNPSTGEKLVDVQEGDKVDVDNAVKAAREAFKSGSPWRKMSPSERGRLLLKLADLVERDRIYMASLETLNSGKTFLLTYNGDMTTTLKHLRYAAGMADKLAGETLPVGDGLLCYTQLQPVGVVGQIIPWNYSLTIFISNICQALACGCTIVAKPAVQTPLNALYVASLCKEAGFPPGVVNVVLGHGPIAGDAIIRHPHVDKITFTGSTEVGQRVFEAATKTNMKRVILELGGKSPLIVFPDVNLDVAVEGAHRAIMTHMGQQCCSGSRTYVHEDIYEEFVRKSVERARRRTVGDPFDPKNESGPQIDLAQLEKILRLIETGRRDGARLMCGGKRIGDRGYFLEPTVFADVTEDMRIGREEIFGPVQSIFKFKTIEEVIERANRTSYGLAAAVFTKDIDKALAIANGVQAGTVWVNTYGKLFSQSPFGGFKMSGFGKDMGIQGFKEYCEVKTVMIKAPSHL